MAPPPHHRLHLLPRLLLLLLLAAAASAAGDGCTSGCSLALASYLISPNQNLSTIAALFNISDYRELGPYNPSITNLDFIAAGASVNINFPCACLATQKAPVGTYLAGSFPYKVRTSDTYASIAANFANLTTADWLSQANSYPATNIPDTATISVTVNCSCGDASISPDYGLFLTYPLSDGQNLTSIARSNNFSDLDLLNKYNPGMSTNTTGLVFIPVKDPNGSYHPLTSSGQLLSFCKLILLI
ncbi:hypothetical protein BS78_07G207700, partial [Paspalum vaginatum]